MINEELIRLGFLTRVQNIQFRVTTTELPFNVFLGPPLAETFCAQTRAYRYVRCRDIYFQRVLVVRI